VNKIGSWGEIGGKPLQTRPHETAKYPIYLKKIALLFRDSYSFHCVAGELWKAAYIEAALMVMFNVRRICICPGCMGIHWNHKQDSKQQDRLCEDCKKKRQQERNSRPKTVRDYFFNMVTQAERRGSLTEEQAETLRRLFLDRGEPLARQEYARLTGGGKSRRKKARASASLEA
jgi:hypothetical protein